SPLSGAQGFTVPIVSWDFKGESYEFALNYSTHSLFDPQALPAPNFGGIGERNSDGQDGTRWSHPFAQWVDLWQDENGQAYAVWHVGNSAISFKGTGPTFDSEESF